MGWAFGAVGTAATSDDARSPGMTVGLPSGVSAGQLLLCFGMRRRSTGAYTWSGPPSGYTEIGSDADGHIKLWAKIAGASESDPVAIAGDATPAICQTARFTGAPASLTGIVHNSNQFSTDSLVVDIQTPGLVVTAPNTLIVTCGGASWNDGSSVTAPDGSTTLGDTNYAGSTFNAWASWSYKIQTAAVDVNGSLFDSTSANTHRTDAFVVSLIPAATANAAPVLSNYRARLVR